MRLHDTQEEREGVLRRLPAAADNDEFAEEADTGDPSARGPLCLLGLLEHPFLEEPPPDRLSWEPAPLLGVVVRVQEGVGHRRVLLPRLSRHLGERFSHHAQRRRDLARRHSLGARVDPVILAWKRLRPSPLLAPFLALRVLTHLTSRIRASHRW